MEEIKIGDTVRFLNDIGGGKVSGFQRGGIVLVEDNDGFEIPMRQSEVVVVPADDPQSPRSNVRNPQPAAPEPPAPTPASTPIPTVADTPQSPEQESLEARVIRLEMTVKRLTMRLERLEAAKALREKVKADSIIVREEQRQKKDDILEVDLHAEELLDTTAGMSPADIKDYQIKIFRKTMNEHMKQKGFRIVFIHGNGDGVLRRAILDDLRRNFKSCEYQDASFQQYGFGATMVTIK